MHSNQLHTTWQSRIARWMPLLLALLLIVCLPTLASACPTCKDSLAESDPSSANLVRGYFWSILFMMSMPFLILGSLVTYFYFEVRKARADQAASGSSPSGVGHPAAG